jgi:hypothetical protein
VRATFFDAAQLVLRGLVDLLLVVLARIETAAARVTRSRQGTTRQGTTRQGTTSALRSSRWSAASLAGDAPSHRRLLEEDGVDEATRVQLAAAWRAAAGDAHAGLRTAAARALELATLGAPPELVTAAHEDALDRVRRVKLCSAVARGLDGRSEALDSCLSPSALGRRPRALPRLAVDVVIDLAISESVSARVDAKLSQRTTDRVIRATLAELAAIEGRHIARAWAIVSWCLEEEPDAVSRSLQALSAGRALLVRQGLETAFASAQRASDGARPQDAFDGGWERWGIAGNGLTMQERARALDAIERKLAELVASSSAMLSSVAAC